MKKFLIVAAIGVALPSVAHAQAAPTPPAMECCEKMKAEDKKCCCAEMSEKDHAEHQESTSTVDHSAH
ncbi:hypothetical protein G7A66_09670 [Altererythrobacter sp. SALINAS58]|uniref:hypothetical protein n=1 Tax=Alteripontixanthobacter muriae TaxID=2705546 RepID=UPI00157623EF|nr:hypothetical protein [Alteripontixanthobacter muriae]NTZ43347.1 hypothetical protein [Alteripontixanthobacter muriae]